MYPVWEVPHLTAGFVLAIVATVHILPSHLSVSAMWLNVWLEWKAEKEDRPELIEFVKRWSKFVLIFCYVFGSLTGVGIWFAATLAAPRGISGLIHNYVWGWASEWCFFLIEVAGIFVYTYTVDKLDRRTHLTLGLVFAAGSWITMVIITGVLGFMLTPGQWNATGAFFDGFFNQSYWPQLFLRTTAMFAVTGVYAVLVAAGTAPGRARDTVVRFAALAGAAGLLLAAPCLAWYRHTLPEGGKAVLDALMTPSLRAFMLWPPAAVLAYFGLMALRPSAARTVPALAAVVVLFSSIFALERGRELVRKPWLMPGYMYSNGLVGGDLPAKGVASEAPHFAAEGLLHAAPFVPEGLRTVSDANRLEAGRMLALVQCSACHTLDKAGLRPLPAMVRRAGLDSAEAASGFLDAVGAYPYMPPFMGDEAEKAALGAYLARLAGE